MRLGVLNAELSIFTIEGLKELEGIQEHSCNSEITPME